MNTKTTKFLAVLAVLAMAFASIAIITTSDSSDATVTTTVDGVKISDTTGFGVTVDDDVATFVGTVATNSVYSAVANTYGFTMDVTGITSPAITKVKIIDTAFQGLATPADYVEYKSSLDAITFPMPKDGSSATVELYSGTSVYVLEETITLDFSNAFTQVTLSAAGANSIGYDGSDPPVSYWVYEIDSTNSNAGVLTLNNYGGNEIFVLENTAGTTVDVNGNNYLAFAIPDESTITGFYAGIYATTALALKGEGNLSVEFDYGENITAGATNTDNGWVGGIIAMKGLTTQGADTTVTTDDFTGDISIVGNGYIETMAGKKDVSGKVFGIIVSGSTTIGATGNNVDINIDLPLDENWSIGLSTWNNTADVFMNGTIVSGCKGMFFSQQVDLVGDKIDISASEAAITIYSSAANTTFAVTELNLSITEYDAHNDGANGDFALTVKASTTIVSGTINTDGLAVTSAGGLSLTSGIVNVSGDYKQNPETTDYDPDFSGFYWGPTTTVPAFAIYNAKPVDTSVTSYVLLTDCDTYGAFTILNSQGKEVQSVITAVANLTTEKLKLNSATTVYATISGSEALSAELEVPTWMTLILKWSSSSALNQTISAGSQSATFSAMTGTFTINTSGMILDTVSALGITAAKGSLTIEGTDSATTGSIAASSSSLAITLADKLAISDGCTLTITGTKTTVTIPEEAGVTVNEAIDLTVKSFTVAGTLTQGATDAKVTVKGDATVSGTIVGIASAIAEIITLDASSSVDVTGVTGFGTAALIGTATNYITATNLTGFKLATDANSAVTASGTLGQYGVLESSAVIAGTISASDITVGEDVTVNASSATKLGVEGKLTVEGILNAGGKVIVGTTKNSTVAVSGAVQGAITVGGAVLTFNDSSAAANVSGYALANDLTNSTVTMSGSMEPFGNEEDLTTTLTAALTVTSGTLTMKDVSMDEYMQIVINSDAGIKGTVDGPTGEGVTFNAKGSSSTFSITAGSLTIVGAIADIDSNAPGIAVTDGIVTLGNVTVLGTVEVDNSATLALTANLVVGTIALKDTSGLIGASYLQAGSTVTAASGTTTDAYNTQITYTDGSYVYYTSGSNTYLCKVQTFSGKQYMAGVKLYSYTGTGVTPLTEKTIKAIVYNITDAAAGTVLGAAIKKTVADAVDVVDDAVAITVATNCVISAPVEVIPGTAKITLTVDGTEAKWVTTDYDTTIWDISGNVLTGTFEVSDKTETFGVLPVPSTIKTGYVFDKWVTLGETPVAYDATIPMYTYTNALADTVEFKYTIASIYDTTYTVTFDSNGGSAVASQTVKYATKADEPDAPVKADYKFVAWYTEAELINKYNFRTAVTEDITLYAKWELDETVYASAVDIAVSKISGGVKVTVAGEDDLAVPAGTVTVKYAYWITVESTKILQWKSVDKTMTAGPIVNSIEVTGLGSAVFVEVSYASADGEVTGSTPRIVY